MGNGIEWETKHGQVINDFLREVNQTSSAYVLKGGTSLMMCYGLDRFSEDVDFDSTDKETIFYIVDQFCRKNEFAYRIAKDTDSVKRFMIHYDNKGNNGTENLLKVEISYRNRSLNPDHIRHIDGITVYDIDSLALMKSNAYLSRDKLRDFYDVVFIGNHYWDLLNDTAKDSMRLALSEKGIEQFDYLVETQHDDLIQVDQLANDFLDLYDKLDLCMDEEEQQNLSRFVRTRQRNN